MSRTGLWLRRARVNRTLRAPRPSVGLLGAWAGLIVVARVVVLRLVEDGRRIRIPFPPLDATLDWRPSWRLVFAITVGAAAVVWAPRAARDARWRTVLTGSTVLGAAWAVALAMVDGVHGLVASVGLKNEYFLDVGRVGSPGEFLRGFVGHIETYRVHVQGHPPGFLLTLWSLDWLGFGSQAATATLEIAVGVLAIPAVLLTVREVAGEQAARAAAPFVACAPIAIWIATSADAFYTGVSAWAVALVVLATGRRDRRGDALALAGGVLFGVTAFLSYGLVLLALVPAVVAWDRRRVRPLAVATLGALPVFLVFALAGFWWFDGLAATHARYFAGVAARRPYAEFFVANLACFAIALGPALAIALAWLRDRRLWTLVGAALAAVALAALSGMSKGEVERIWLPFAVWVLPAAAALGLVSVGEGGRVGGISPERAARWLAVQVAFAIGLQTLVRSPW
jgi:methylthioxylose transferase